MERVSKCGPNRETPKHETEVMRPLKFETRTNDDERGGGLCGLRIRFILSIGRCARTMFTREIDGWRVVVVMVLVLIMLCVLHRGRSSTRVE